MRKHSQWGRGDPRLAFMGRGVKVARPDAIVWEVRGASPFRSTKFLWYPRLKGLQWPRSLPLSVERLIGPGADIRHPAETGKIGVKVPGVPDF